MKQLINTLIKKIILIYIIYTLIEFNLIKALKLELKIKTNANTNSESNIKTNTNIKSLIKIQNENKENLKIKNNNKDLLQKYKNIDSLNSQNNSRNQNPNTSIMESVEISKFKILINKIKSNQIK